MSKDEYSCNVDNDFQVRVLKIAYKDSVELPRYVIMYQYTSWPDMGVPKSPKSLERLIDLINLDLFQIPPIHMECPPAPTKLPSEAEKSLHHYNQQQQSCPRPILVHCSVCCQYCVFFSYFFRLVLDELEPFAHYKSPSSKCSRI